MLPGRPPLPVQPPLAAARQGRGRVDARHGGQVDSRQPLQAPAPIDTRAVARPRPPPRPHRCTVLARGALAVTRPHLLVLPLREGHRLGHGTEGFFPPLAVERLGKSGLVVLAAIMTAARHLPSPEDTTGCGPVPCRCTATERSNHPHKGSAV